MRERGYLYWLSGPLADTITNRSLRQVAFRASAWTSADPKYEYKPVEDPNRSELLTLYIAEKGRFEAWTAPISRSTAGLPTIGSWELYGTDQDEIEGNIPFHIRAALRERGATRAATMPAADMVLGPWDVPRELFPVAEQCGPLDFAEDKSTSTYFAIFRGEKPGPVIVSQAFVYKAATTPRGHLQGAMEALVRKKHIEFEGPPLGVECHYLVVKPKEAPLHRYTALWRYPGVVCEVSIAGPPGHYTKRDLYRYATIQHKGATAQLDNGHRSA